MSTYGAGLPTAALRDGAAVSPLELFYDLVFVFALIQVTATMADDLTAQRVAEGLLVVGLLWWSWATYAWLGNLARTDVGILRLGMFAAVAGMFVLALCIPEAFDDRSGGVSGPVVVAACYFAVRAVHLVSFYALSRDDAGLRSQVLRFAPSMLIATGLLICAAFTGGSAQLGLWTAALGADYLGTYLGGAQGWRIRSVGHFAERHGLIVLVALGESLVAIGVGVSQLPVSWPIVAASVLGLTLSAALWWAYFDVTAPVAERALAAAPEALRAGMARDAYTFLHLPIVAGIVLIALGLKKVLEYVGDQRAHELSDPLPGIALAALVGGAVIYLLAQVAFQVRTAGLLNRRRLAMALLLLALVPAGPEIPAVASLGLLTASMVALVASESLGNVEGHGRFRRAASSA